MAGDGGARRCEEVVRFRNGGGAAPTGGERDGRWGNGGGGRRASGHEARGERSDATAGTDLRGLRAGGGSSAKRAEAGGRRRRRELQANGGGGAGAASVFVAAGSAVEMDEIGGLGAARARGERGLGANRQPTKRDGIKQSERTQKKQNKSDNRNQSYIKKR